MPLGEPVPGVWPRQESVFSLAKISIAGASHSSLPNKRCSHSCWQPSLWTYPMSLFQGKVFQRNAEISRWWIRKSLALLSHTVTVYWDHDLDFSVVSSDSHCGTGGEKEASCTWILLLRVHRSRLYLPGISSTADKCCTEEQREAAHQPALYKQYLFNQQPGLAAPAYTQPDSVFLSLLRLSSLWPWKWDLPSTSQGRKADRAHQRRLCRKLLRYNIHTGGQNEVVQKRICIEIDTYTFCIYISQRDTSCLE